MSYKQWNAVVLLLASLVIAAWVGYDAIAGGGYAGPAGHVAQTVVYAIIASIVLNIAALIVVTIVVSIVSREQLRDERSDERDRAIIARAMRNAFLVLSVGALATLAVLGWGPGGNAGIYTLFAAMTLANLTDCASRLFYYRVG